MRCAHVLLLLASFSVLTACTQGKPPQSQAWPAATGAEAYERLWWKAVQERDFKTVSWHLAPIYTLANSSGIRDHDGAMQYFQSLDLTKINIAELQVNPQGADMVVSYVADLEIKSSSAPQRYYMTTVWQQGKKGWMAISHSETPAETKVTSGT